MAQRPPSLDSLLGHVDELQTQVDAGQRLLEHLQAQRVADKTKIANLEISLTTARRIGAAVGILMATEHVAEGQAFKILVEASNAQHRKVSDIAAGVVATGKLPVVLSG